MRDSKMGRRLGIVAACSFFHAASYAQCLDSADEKTRIGAVKEAFACWKASNRALQTRLDEAAASNQSMQVQVERAVTELKSQTSRADSTKATAQSLRDEVEGARRELSDVKRELASLRAENADSKKRLADARAESEKKLEKLKADAERNNLLLGGSKMRVSDKFRSGSFPFFLEISADAQVADEKLQLSDVSLRIDQSDGKFPFSVSQKYKIVFWLVAWNAQSGKWLTTAAQEVCCWTRELDEKVVRLTPQKVLQLPLINGVAVGKTQIAVAVKGSEETGQASGTSTDDLQDITTKK